MRTLCTACSSACAIVLLLVAGSCDRQHPTSKAATKSTASGFGQVEALKPVHKKQILKQYFKERRGCARRRAL